MSERSYSTVEYLAARLAEIRPSLEFTGSTEADWRQWRSVFDARLRERLGPIPEPPEAEVETISEHREEGYVRHKIAYRTERDCWVPAYVLVPVAEMPEDGFPALLCCHGHGHGKDNVAGVVGGEDGSVDQSKEERLDVHNYDYARQFVRRGYVCLAPDWRCFGERSDGTPYPGRDKCNVNFLIGSLMGFNLLALDVWDAMRGIDYLGARPDVNAQRIGCLGLSFGGTMTTFVSAVDERVRAACISGYLSLWTSHIFPGGGICGSQYLPGLLAYGDIPEVAGLIAPRPLLIERGTRDTTFPVEGARAAAERLRRVYRAAGCEDRLVEDEFNGAHEFHGAVAFGFFDRWLGPRG